MASRGSGVRAGSSSPPARISRRARRCAHGVLISEFPAGGMDWRRLTACQRDAAEGLYAQALAGYLRWLAPRYEIERATLPVAVRALRDELHRAGQRRRTPDMIAELLAGLEVFLRFASACGALTAVEGDALRRRCRAALAALAARQPMYQAAGDPVRRFLQLFGDALASGRAHLADPRGGVPPHSQAWGWRGEGEVRPQGERIGWVEGENVYLVPNAAYGVAQRLGRETSDPLTVTLHTLTRRLAERKLLLSTGTHSETLSVRRTLEGSRRLVLHLPAALFCPPPTDDHSAALVEGEPGQPCHKALLPDCQASDGRIAALARADGEANSAALPASDLLERPRHSGDVAGLAGCRDANLASCDGGWGTDGPRQGGAAEPVDTPADARSTNVGSDEWEVFPWR